MFALCSSRLSRLVTQHFLLSAAARSLSPSRVVRMSDREAEDVFARLRWPETEGKPICPRCNCQTCYDCRRSAKQPRWRCKACRSDFSMRACNPVGAGPPGRQSGKLLARGSEGSGAGAETG